MRRLFCGLLILMAGASFAQDDTSPQPITISLRRGNIQGCSFDGHSAKGGCMLDTGANISMLPADLYSWGKTNFSGPPEKVVGACMSETPMSCGELTVASLRLAGQLIATNVVVNACHPGDRVGLIGMNILDGKIWTMDFIRQKLSEETEFPASQSAMPLERVESGYAAYAVIPVSLGDTPGKAFIDTGWTDGGAVDRDYVLAHPNDFQCDRQIITLGPDSCGQSTSVSRCKLAKLDFGGLESSNGIWLDVEDFSKDPLKLLKDHGVSLIIGHGTLLGTILYLDLKNNVWSVDIPDR